MSLEANAASVRRHFDDVWNRRDVAVVDEIYAPDMTYQGELVTRDGWKTLLEPWYVAFPDLHYTVEQLVAQGELVAVNARLTGTQRGVFHYRAWGPWAPSGKSFDVRVMLFFRMVEGRIAEVQATMDSAAFTRQLGA